MSDWPDKNEAASQSSFSRLVGVSQQAISQLVTKGVLPRNGTYGDWLTIYIDRLRTEAAGRAGDNSDSVQQQRMKESEQKTLSLAISNGKELDQLTIAAEVAMMVNQTFSNVASELNNAGVKIQERIESELSLTVNDEHIFGPIRDAAESIAKIANECGEDLSRGGEGFDTQAAITDF